MEARLLDLIYGAVSDPQLWPDVLVGVADQDHAAVIHGHIRDRKRSRHGEQHQLKCDPEQGDDISIPPLHAIAIDVDIVAIEDTGDVVLLFDSINLALDN